MRYLNKIIFLNSAHIPYAEVKLDGNVHFIGTQGVGKSTLLRALLFFYNADKLRLGIPKEKKSFDAFYFPYPNSYIVYEVMRENGAYCVLALKNQGRVMFRFIDAPFDSKWFIDEHKQVYGEWNQIREQVGKKHDISSLVSSYEMYRDIIFGNNRRLELQPFRKYAIVESAKYQNIPRTIQNVFLNTKLDADFIKNTIIRSMSDEDNCIDLNFYREQIKEFEQEYKDVSLWTKKEKNGEVLVRRMADKVIDAYRTLLNNRRLIGEGRRELNYAERVAQELLPQYRLDIQESEAECNRVNRLIGEEQEKYGKERDKLSRELGVLDAQLKKTADKRKHYEEIHIEDILQRVEQETIIEEERKRQEAMKAELDAELAFIRKNRDVVAVYRNDKIELFDQETSVRQKRKNKAEALMAIEDKFWQRSERLKLQLSVAQSQLTKQQTALKKLDAGLNAVRSFRRDETLCPLESNEIEEKITTKDCLTIVEELKRQIYEDGRSLDNFKKQSQQFLGMFSAHNTFHFNVSPVTEEEFIAFASNLCEFVENDKISEYQKRISGRYTDIIFRISKEVGDLTRREGDIGKTINDINHDFEERNFAGVIREIALRPLKANDQLMLLLLRIRDFAEENQFNMGEMDLFATESRQDVNAKAVKYLLAFMKGLLDEPNRKQLQVADTFKLEFRIKENDNDTGWVEKIANVGSDGTDILVKAMVNIMLINVFKEKASKKSGDFKIHCMMDEIGKLHPNNVKGILDFANRRNILLVNSSPTTYNVEDYKYTYLLSKDNRANTKVTQLIKRL